MMCRLPVSLTNKKNLELVLLVFFIVAVSAICFHADFSTKFIPSNNGAHHPVQARSLLEYGRPQFVQFPLNHFDLRKSTAPPKNFYIFE